MGGVAGHRGLWGFVRGGMGTVSEAIARRREPAAPPSAPTPPWHESWCEADAPRASCSRTATRLKQPRWASNLDPKITFLRLLDEKDLDNDFVTAIRRFRIEGTSCKINLALNGLPEFNAYPGVPGPHHKATMHICPSVEYVERAWDDAKYGRASERPLLELTVPTMYDPSLAPAASTSWESSCNTRRTRCVRARGTNCASHLAIA